MKTPDSDLRVYFQGLTLPAPFRIFDKVQETSAGNYIHLSDMRAEDVSTETSTVWDVEVLFDIVTFYSDNRTGGRKLCDSVSDTLINQITNNRETLTNFKIVRARPLNTNYIDEATESGTFYRKLVRMNLIVEQIN